MSDRLDIAVAAIQPANDTVEQSFLTDAGPAGIALFGLIGDGLLRALFGDGPPTYIAARDGCVIYANASYRRLAEDGGRDGLLVNHRQILERVVRQGQPVVHQETLAGSDEPRVHTVRHVPIPGPGGEVLAVAGCFADASVESAALARARREKQRFQDVVRSTSDWVWETDETGRVSFVSDRITEVLGVPPVLMRGRPLTRLGHFLDTGEEGFGALRAMARRRPFRDCLLQIDEEGGRRRLFHLSGVPVFDDGGRFLGYRGTAAEVTARHMAEEAARHSRRALEKALAELTDKNLQLDLALRRATAATRAKTEFLATMSHELRTPLNAIIGFSEVMHLSTFGTLPHPYSGYVSDILGAGRHLLELIDDILDVARIEGDTMRLDIREVPVSRLVAEARAMVESRAGEKGIDIRSVAYAGPMQVRADQTRTMQVLLNLLGNAVKFTPEGGTVGVEIAEAAPGMARITVWDNGTGIPADKRDLIFEKFQQAHESILARSQEGIGLGLTLSRQLARLMDGDLVLDHSDLGGSRFSILLPLAEGETTFNIP